MLFTQNHNHDSCLNFFTLHTLFDNQGGDIYIYIIYIYYIYISILYIYIYILYIYILYVLCCDLLIASKTFKTDLLRNLWGMVAPL